jgi:hypothetical protein
MVNSKWGVSQLNTLGRVDANAEDTVISIKERNERTSSLKMRNRSTGIGKQRRRGWFKGS